MFYEPIQMAANMAITIDTIIIRIQFNHSIMFMARDPISEPNTAQIVIEAELKFHQMHFNKATKHGRHHIF